MQQVKSKTFFIELQNGERVNFVVSKNSIQLASDCSNDGFVSFCPSMRSSGVSMVNHAQVLVNNITEVVNDVGQFARFE